MNNNKYKSKYLKYKEKYNKLQSVACRGGTQGSELDTVM